VVGSTCHSLVSTIRTRSNTLARLRKTLGKLAFQHGCHSVSYADSSFCNHSPLPIVHFRAIIIATPPHSVAIGLRCVDGVILAVERLVQSQLLVKGSNRRIGSVDPHIGIVGVCVRCPLEKRCGDAC
jgi:hypothetical protein